MCRFKAQLTPMLFGDVWPTWNLGPCLHCGYDSYFFNFITCTKTPLKKGYSFNKWFTLLVVICYVGSVCDEQNTSFVMFKHYTMCPSGCFIIDTKYVDMLTGIYPIHLSRLRRAKWFTNFSLLSFLSAERSFQISLCGAVEEGAIKCFESVSHSSAVPLPSAWAHHRLVIIHNITNKGNNKNNNEYIKYIYIKF